MKAVVFAALTILGCLIAFAEEPPAGQTWSGNFGAGLSLTRGNSDTSNINLALELAQRISARNLGKYDAFYLRGDKDGELTVDRTTLGARDEFTISPLTYATSGAFGETAFDVEILTDGHVRRESLRSLENEESRRRALPPRSGARQQSDDAQSGETVDP